MKKLHHNDKRRHSNSDQDSWPSDSSAPLCDARFWIRTGQVASVFTSCSNLTNVPPPEKNKKKKKKSQTVKISYLHHYPVKLSSTSVLFLSKTFLCNQHFPFLQKRAYLSKTTSTIPHSGSAFHPCTS